MASPLNGRSYQREVTQRLAEYEPDAVWALQLFLRKRPRPGAAKLAFEVHFYPLTRSLPVFGYWMSEANSQLGSPVQPLLAKLFTRAAEQRFRDAEVETLELSAPAVQRWFRKLWKTAGGALYPLPVVIQLHDGGDEFVLAKGRPART